MEWCFKRFSIGFCMKKNGCYDRAPYAESQVLHGISSATGFYVRTEIPHTMSKDCQYQKNDKYSDPGCVGCKHKQEKQQ